MPYIIKPIARAVIIHLAAEGASVLIKKGIKVYKRIHPRVVWDRPSNVTEIRT